MTDAPNDWTDNDLEQLSRIAPSAEAIATHLGREYGWSESRVIHCTKHIQDALDKDAFHQGANWMLDDIRGSLTGWPHLGCDTVAGKQVERIVALREAAALEQAAEHIPEQSHEATGYLIRCACGWKSLAYKVDWRIEDGSSRGFSEWQQHIRALSPSPNYIALREAEARIREANEAKQAERRCKSVSDYSEWIETRIATLTEARDKLAKK